MKSLSLFILLLQFSFLSHASMMCGSYYGYNKPTINLSQNFSKVFSLSSGRKMKGHFFKGKNFEKNKEVKFILHGLGKSSKDLHHVFEKAQKEGDSLFVVDLHGFGETSQLNQNYPNAAKIPYEHNRDDVLEILKSIDPKYKIKLIGHSYGGGIALKILESLKQQNVKLNFSKVILLSPLAKSIDKYFQDSSFSGQNIQVSMDYLNPIIKQMGISGLFIENLDYWNNMLLFNSNSIAQKTRDFIFATNPFLETFRENANVIPNYAANMFLAPFHILANSDMTEINYWQMHPFELQKLLFNNILVINGSRNLNFLDYSQNLNLPEDVTYKVVHAQNDSVNPNTVTQELQTRMLQEGFSVEHVSLIDEGHYYLYSKEIDNFYHLITD